MQFHSLGSKTLFDDYSDLDRWITQKYTKNHLRFTRRDYDTIQPFTHITNTSFDTEGTESMSGVMTFELQGGLIHVGNMVVDRNQAIFMFIIGMMLGIFIFFFTLKLFDQVIRPRCFPTLPSIRNTRLRSLRDTYRAPTTPIERYRLGLSVR
ncbi:hypothetical protein NHQ30_005755 [Ciborinia camelliae]|nr:hypothetical protein NHQ30_005755 [Ciborinia camelliae]